MRAYKIYVLPILDYCSSVYNPWKVSDINLLERIQRRFTKNILKNGMSYEDRLKHLRICSLEKRRLILDLLLTYKILHGKIPDLINMFCYNDVPSNTRSTVSSLPKIPKFRLDIKKYCFPNRMSKIFNLLSVPLKSTNGYNPGRFKTNLEAADLSSFTRGAYKC